MKTFTVELTHEEIEQLAIWHKECERRFAEMREYTYANLHKNRIYLFDGIKNSADF